MQEIHSPDSINNSSQSLSAKTTGTDDTPSILTPVPAGQRWRLKSLNGEAVELLPAIFASRLEALGAGVLLARQCDAELVP